MTRRLPRLALLIVIVGGMLSALAAVAQEDTTTFTPELEAQMDSLEQSTRNIRQIDGETVERRFPTRSEVIDYLENSFETTLPPDEVERYERFYIALGLMDADVDLREIYLTLLGSQVAGFYDPDTRTMNVIPTGNDLESLSVTEQIIFVHEYVHALQDQHFDLNRLLEDEAVSRHPDRALAVLALVEGDATAVMNVYTQAIVAQYPLAGFQILAEAALAGNLTLPPDLPGILVRELMLPYETGLTFVTALHEAGGWERVNDAYANPPTTAEHVLHPETFLAGDMPVEVELADAEAALGGGWTRIWDTRLGEWYLREHLRAGLNLNIASQAAAGWGGDRLHIYYEPARDLLAWALRLRWDTPADADEFRAAYADLALERFGTPAEDDCWLGEGAVCLRELDGEILVVQAPDLDTAQALLRAQAAS